MTEPHERLQEIKKRLREGICPPAVDVDEFNVHEKLLPRIRHDDDEIVLAGGTIWLICFNGHEGNLGGHSVAWCCSASPELVREIRALARTIHRNET
jgi:hypothetical protein